MIIKTPGIKFDEEKHVYTRASDGYLLAGVTSILQIRAKDFLKWWTTKRNYEYMMEHWDLEKKYTQEEKEFLLLTAKNAHTQVTKDANNKGSAAHKWFSLYIKGKNPILPTDPEILNCVNSLLEWEKEHRVKWIASEFLVYSEKYLFAGTLDAIAKVDDRLSLIDFKTSNAINEEYFLQTAGYQIALEEMGIKPEQRLILRFPKNADQFEALVVKSDLEFDKEIFLHCREIYKWNSYINNNKEMLGLKTYGNTK